jgi:ubiquitin carboxyl-terminal hydrolase 36/42
MELRVVSGFRVLGLGSYQVPTIVFLATVEWICTICSTCSNTYDPLLDISLVIVRADSLTKALNRFTAVEALEGDNKYHCGNCRKKVRALKQFTIDKSPNILTVQFKRFSGTGSSGGKIDKKIEFGRTLDMKPYISNPQVFLVFQ